MKVTTWIEFSEEREIDVSVEEFLAALPSSAARVGAAVAGLSKFGQFLRGLPDSVIAEMSPVHVKIVQDFLLEQAPRFRRAPALAAEGEE